MPCKALRDHADYAAAREAIEPLLGFEDQLNKDQTDYVEAVSSFLEAYDSARVKWPKSSPLATLKFLLQQYGMSATDLARVLRSDRSLGPKLLRGERRLTVEHIRTTGGLAWWIAAAVMGALAAVSKLPFFMAAGLASVGVLLVNRIYEWKRWLQLAALALIGGGYSHSGAITQMNWPVWRCTLIMT